MRVRVTACVCVCLMRLLLAKTFNIVSFEKKRIKKKVCVQFVAITREERKRKERERDMRERERPCFFESFVSFGRKRETRRRANALTSSYIILK
jgi:hypothetical protein